MAQTKIYPSTQAQVQAVQDTVNEINSKIVAPTYQAKIVTPTTMQQLVEPDNGYDALSSVTVNPAQTTDLDNWISRNDQQEPIYLELTTDKIASYACYEQSRLVSFKGDNVTLIGTSAFQGCTSLQDFDANNVTSIDVSAFYGCTGLRNIDMRNATSIGIDVFRNCTNLQLIDCTSRATPPTIQATSFRGTNNSFKVVVATDTEKALFQAATNWSVRASQIYTVAEIEALVGMTYDEYYFQCFGHPRNEV